ncbi:helix-turn-helix domain-containing protein [Bariatricus sp. HCP28S3_A7]|uniref:helix-turn-helix domain-containing protein n=1 Tax=Bariatricus sp. HCP28S3_A7 TaxID=3438894 RepID=UPI003F8A3A8C
MSLDYNLPEINIGQVIKRLREIKGYSATSFAEELEWSKSLLSKVENGNRSVSVEELYKIACVLGEPIEKFFPEITAADEDDDRESISLYVDDVRNLYYEISKLGDNSIPVDIEQEASRLLQRDIPAAIYRFLKVNPNRVSVKGTLKRGPHFIPRIEIHFLDRNRNKIDWFYIVISFKDKIKHIYISLVQSTDIRYRADCEPVEQGIQLDAINDFVKDYLDAHYGTEWKGNTSYDVFFDENGYASEYGSIFSRGYIPVTPPDEYDVWMGRIEDSMKEFIKENHDGFTMSNGITPQYVVNFSRDNGLDDTEYNSFECLDEDLEAMFKMLQILINAVEDRSFVSWKKGLLTSGMVDFTGKADCSDLGWIHHLVEEYAMAENLEDDQKMKYEAVLMLCHLLDTAEDPEAVIDELKRQMDWDDLKFDRELAKTAVGRGIEAGMITQKYMSSNPQRKLKVMAEQNYKCEVDRTHQTFQDRTGHPYMEIHHLIPLRAQDKFKKDLNVEANMVCVCPVCNRKLAHASDDVVEDVVVPLYYAHKDKLKQAGFDISLRQLLEYY